MVDEGVKEGVEKVVLEEVVEEALEVVVVGEEVQQTFSGKLPWPGLFPGACT